MARDDTGAIFAYERQVSLSLPLLGPIAYSRFIETGLAPILDGKCSGEDDNDAAGSYLGDDSQGPIVDLSTFDFEAASAQLGFNVG